MCDCYVNEIIHGDCVEVMKRMNSESIDLIVTDPPYGIEFMGKDWDKAVPSVEVWKECFRVLKPGAFAFIMSSPRLDVLSQMAIRLQEAGFRVDFTPIYWAYASGFPKAMNVSRAIDKKLGLERKGQIKEGVRGEINIYNPTLKRVYEGGPPVSPEAKALEGAYAGFQPKPAVEVIIVAMKPLSEKTYLEQALKNKKGITWLDDGRIPFVSEEDMKEASSGFESRKNRPVTGIFYKGEMIGEGDVNESGRFPANLLVSDDILNDGKITKSRPDFRMGKPWTAQSYSGGWKVHLGWLHEDEGSFSRHFSLDNWWAERIKKLPESVRKTFPFLLVPKASKSERNKELEAFRAEIKEFSIIESDEENENFNTITKNIHPTVKPIQLMSYLIIIGSRENDVILDPFCGSGTTCIAAWMNSRKYIGIEINEDYVKIARARIQYYESQSKITDFT